MRIDINLLPPKKKTKAAALLLPLALVIIGLALCGALVWGYFQVEEKAASLRHNIQRVDQEQAMLQTELQHLGRLQGISHEAQNVALEITRLRPDLTSTLNDLQAPLPAGALIESVNLSGATLLWTCSFPDMKQAGAYSVAVQDRFKTEAALIESVKSRTTGGCYVGTFQLNLTPPLEEEGSAE